MDFRTLDSIKELAAQRNKSLCCWHPYPEVGGVEGRWIVDPSPLKEYREMGLGIDVRHRSHRIIVNKNGTVEGLDFKDGDQVDIVGETEDPQWPERFGVSGGVVAGHTDPNHVLVTVTHSEFKDAEGSNIIFPIASLRLVEE